jgi:hypothetical protein
MAVEAIEQGWDPISAGSIVDTQIHGIQSNYKLTLVLENGIEIKFNNEAMEGAIFEALKMGLTPLKFSDPVLQRVTFHNSADGYATVEVTESRIESRFGEDDENAEA